jgi:methylated-DNA-protein-cysteine methyltransferase-like protein
MSGPDTGFFERVYSVVRRIPRGRVATYGQVAALLGVTRGARAVGWALGGIGSRDRRIPWHRVVGHGGRIALEGRPAGLVQRRRLLAEGVCFTGGRVDLAQHGLLSQSTPTRGSRSRSRAR